MEHGKQTGPKPKWWSRPGDAAPEPGLTDTVPAPAARPVDDQSEYTLAAPEPAPVTTEPPTVPSRAVPASAVPAPTVPGPRTDQTRFEAAEAQGAPAVPDAPGPTIPAQATGGQPLHESDECHTPPYGGPGPWAPAPPVQHPLGTPAHGTAVPVPAQPPAPAGYAPPMPPTPAPVPAPTAPTATFPQPPQWAQYDPWSTPGAAALSQTGEPPKKRRRGSAVAVLLAFGLVTGVAGGAVGAYLERNGGSLTTVELPQAAADNSGRAPGSVAGIAASALPGVVTLHVTGGSASGTGTGFVLDKQGHILTNNHVVAPAGGSGEISVTFSGGETARAKLVGKDSGYDLAVVKVSGVSGLKPLPLGNSDSVRVGDPVVAIGAPFDLQNTVTAGIISAKERPITAGGEKGDGSDVSYVDALQTDAPINPGNSGGPLVDSKARVIGINSAIRAAGSGTGSEGDGSQAGSIGLGFAIPINQGKRVAEELINTGKATHPVIGVSLDMQYAGDGARVGEKSRDGSSSITPGGPAAKAGIRPGDVITKVDGQRVHNGEELIVKIRAHRPGDELELTVVRGGKEQTRTLTLGSSSGT
ncbi:trypsin-like peptidase domain-containing protein [Streptomyces sp. NPDC127084]|uniref:trypsin-like peptidase domain-containing protein n=1 Tax=Streptomyces sp. NPDC127084 TaxID=3347133 RepID=UPI003650FAC6